LLTGKNRKRKTASGIHPTPDRMAKCVFIVQGEGRGHLSQALALYEYLEHAGHVVEAVFAGCNNHRSLPVYFKEAFGNRLRCFASPYFLRTPNKKGIYVGRTILFNLLLSTRYLSEVKRIRREIGEIQPDVVFNFYDVVGALALRKVSPEIRRIGIGHHFFLHLGNYNCRGGNPLHRRFLKLHTKAVIRSCDRVLALSFREVPGDGRISVVPPLVRKMYREAEYRAGSRYLVYLLNEGFVADLIAMARHDPGFEADLFSDLPADAQVPAGIRLHGIGDREFMQKMTCCRGLITTAGFDAVAEAAYLGVPLVVVPVRNHFEQRCNSIDVEQSGLGVARDAFLPVTLLHLKKIDNSAYKSWVDRAGELIINHVEG
jgi:uncharacterized protein (TIGR00661 family)